MTVETQLAACTMALAIGCGVPGLALAQGPGAAPPPAVEKFFGPRQGFERDAVARRHADGCRGSEPGPLQPRAMIPLAFSFDHKTLHVTVPDPDGRGLAAGYAFDPDRNELGQRLYDNEAIDAARSRAVTEADTACDPTLNRATETSG